MRSSFLYSVLAGLVLTSLGLSSADADAPPEKWSDLNYVF